VFYRNYPVQKHLMDDIQCIVVLNIACTFHFVLVPTYM
jgi:hypothetical protein